MPDEIKGKEKDVKKEKEVSAEDLTKKVEQIEQNLAAMTKRAEEAERGLAISKLDADDRSAFEALSKEDKEKYHACKEETCKDALLDKGYDAIEKAAAAAKAVPEPVKKELDELKKQLADERSKREASEAVVRKAQDEVELAKAVKLAGEIIPNLPGTVDENGALLKALKKSLDEKTYDGVVTLLKAANISHGKLTTPIGKDGATAAETAGGTAEAKLEKLAKAAAAEQKITFHKAYDQVLMDPANKALYNEYLNEQQQRVRN